MWRGLFQGLGKCDGTAEEDYGCQKPLECFLLTSGGCFLGERSEGCVQGLLICVLHSLTDAQRQERDENIRVQ